jgi:hypothetical protein
MKVLLPILATLILPLSAQLRITEVMSDSNHSDPDGGDWFEITNVGTGAVNVAGYRFDDDSDDFRNAVIIPSHDLSAGASMIVLAETTASRFKTLWNLDASVHVVTISNFPGLGKGGDTVFLYNSGGTRIDTFAFGAASEGFSFARFRDGSSVPGGLSSDGLFGAYESDDPEEEDFSEDVGSPGLAPNLPEPLPPFFNTPFNTAWIAGSALSISEYRIRTIDPNPGDTITLTSSGTPTWLTVTDLGGGIARLGGTPPVAAIGSHEFEITATDNTNRAASQTYRINVLSATSPIILNEYNAVDAGEFLDGGGQNDGGAPSDPVLGRIEGNGGQWVEFVVTQTTDFRGWTLKIENDARSRILKLSDHIALSNIAAGTILTFTNSKQTSPTWLNRTTGSYTWSNIWMHDAILIDQAKSTHPAGPTINSNDTRFTWSNAADAIIYGPSGESIARKDSNDNGIGDDPVNVGGTEVFKLEANPASTVTPLNVNYDDGGTSTFGSPNKWSDNSMTQSFLAFAGSGTPPAFGSVSETKAVRGAYAVTITAPTATVTVLQAPDFLSVNTAGGNTVISNNRPLTFADIGTYEITLQADNGAATNNLGYLVYELEVLNPAPAVVLNEYNAVDPNSFLNGTAVPTSSDSHFGRIVGNGGNWFELAVTGNGTSGYTNLTGWSIEVGKIASSGKFVSGSTIVLSDPGTWSAIANGTLLTFIDKNTAAGGLDTGFNRENLLASDGYAWSNIYLGTPGIISGSNLTTLAIDSDNTAFLIKDPAGTVIFGPAGEGVAPLSGVNGTEIFKLENDASPLVSPIDVAITDTMLGYDDGSSGSTFGSPNLFSPLGTTTDRAQDFSAFVQSPLQIYFADLGIPGADPIDDADLDGYSNLDEYLLGGNPVNPVISPITVFDPVTNTTSVNARVSDPNFVLIPQRSSDLQSWVANELDKVDEASSLGPDFVLRNFTYTGTESRMFFRVTSDLQD